MTNMTSKLKSAMLRRTGSIRRPTVESLTDNFRSSRSDNYDSNNYINSSFIENDNYKSILECIDGGYQVCHDIYELMQEHCDSVKADCQKYNAFSKKAHSIITKQSVISSYNTTKRAQYDLFAVPEQRAKILERRRNAIQAIINEYHQEINRLYPKEDGHKHYQSTAMKGSFKAACRPLLKSKEKLESLYKDQKAAEKKLLEAQIECENLSFSTTASSAKKTSAANTQDKRDKELSFIKQQIELAKNEFANEQERFRTRALEIYKECRQLEEQRLNLIGETLIKFNHAAFNDDEHHEYKQIYEKTLTKLKTDRNTLADLDFWAKCYHVYDSKTPRASLSSQGSDTDSIRPESSLATNETANQSQQSHTNNGATSEISV